MAIMLRGPIKMHDAMNLIYSITESFYMKHVDLGEIRDYAINPVFWSEGVINPQAVEKLPTYEGSYIRHNYNQLVQRKKLALIRSRASEFVSVINSRAIHTGIFTQWHNHLKTRILNKTVLEDVISGQNIPPTVSEFVFKTWVMTRKRKWLEDFIKHRNKMIKEAQERLNQSVSGAAYNLMKDLR